MAKLNPETLQTVNFRISEDELATVDRLALKAGITRSQFLRNLVTVGLEEATTFEKFGILRASITIRDILDWMKNKVEAEEGTPQDAEKEKG